MNKYILLSLGFIFSLQSMAKDGSSGCGPGWYVLQKNSLLSSTLRATTNGILFPTTTIGMTLGTSNCSKHSLVRTEKETLHFAINNFYELKSEIAKGSGEFLIAFSETLGCKTYTQSKLNKELKLNYKKIFKTNKAENGLKEIYRIILSDKELVTSCSLS